jgi:catalase (peroxidase I)
MMNAGNLSLNALCAALGRERPVIARFEDGTGRHYAVISGLVMDVGGTYLEVADPDGGREVQIPFQPGQVVVHANWRLNAVFFI